MKSTALFTFAIAVACWPSLLSAESPTPLTDPAELFSRLDRNHDGRLEAGEIDPQHASLFRKLLSTADADHDGSLTQAELTAGLKDNRPQHPLERLPDPPSPEEIARAAFRRLDGDRNGRLELKEIPPRRQAEFRKLLPTADKDGDGALNPAEFKAVYEQLLAEPPKPASEGPAPDAATLLKRLMQMDANGDGRINPQEARGILKNRFDKLDSDGNGVLDQAELRKAAERLAKSARDPEHQMLNERLKSLQDQPEKK